jgi:hypothetical protein
MSDSYPNSPTVLKGALIQFATGGLVPVPNLILFQYNPESITRTLHPWSEPQTDSDPTNAHDTSQPFDPRESFSVTLELDAADALEFPDSHPVAVAFGIADRIAALEMLLYPQYESALSAVLGAVASGSLSGAVSNFTGGSAASSVPRGSVPVVLFLWGPGRIMPVRLLSFRVEEQAYSPTLYPLRAKVVADFLVLTDKSFTSATPTAAERIAKAAYQFTAAQKKVLAQANTANSVESIMGMLPF